MRASKLVSAAVFMVAVFSLSFGYAFAGPPDHANSKGGKAYICHFEDEHLYQGTGKVFFTVPASQRFDNQPEPLTGDYVIFYETMRDNPAGGMSFCEGYGGEVLLVSVSSLGSDDDHRGHRVQLLDRVDGSSPATEGYPDGFKGF